MAPCRLLLSLLLLPVFLSGEEWWHRTDWSWGLREGAKPIWSVETVQPLYQDPSSHTHHLLWQGRVSHQDSDQTLNLGIAYRYLSESVGVLWGVNSFLDFKRRNEHFRWGVGVEALSCHWEARFNYYDNLSGRKKFPWTTGVQYSERSIDGYDIEARGRLPYFPWAFLNATYYHWKGHSVPSLGGGRASLLCHLTPLLSLECGQSFDNYSHDLYCRLDFHLGCPQSVEYTLSDGWIQDCPWSRVELQCRALSKVRRHHDLIIETREVGGAGILIGRGA